MRVLLVLVSSCLLVACPKSEPTVTEMPIATKPKEGGEPLVKETKPDGAKPTTTMSIPLEPNLDCEADSDCALFGRALKDGGTSVCCPGCGSKAVNAKWRNDAVSFCKDHLKNSMGGCAKFRCERQKVEAKCVEKKCTTKVVQSELRFPKQFMQCKTAADCALTLLDTHNSEQFCCKRCSPGEPAAKSWTDEVARICKSVDTSSCPKRKCAKRKPMQPDCVEGACVAVPVK